MRPQHCADRLVLQAHHIHQPPIRDFYAGAALGRADLAHGHGGPGADTHADALDLFAIPQYRINEAATVTTAAAERLDR